MYAETGDLMLGALGSRSATLETVGDWTAIGPDLRMDALTGGGLIGRALSRATAVRQNIPLLYRGHVVMDGRKRTMGHYAPAVNGAEGFRIPTVLTIGSSMSSGKTTSVKAVIRALKKMSLTVAAAKLTGAARWSDALAMGDAGADHFFDFVDAGLPSTIGPPEEVGPALRALLQRIQSLAPDVFVAEVGASPLEPYNGGVALDALGDSVVFRVLSGSDPYAVLGACDAFNIKPDLVTGRTANTTAAVLMVERLTRLRAIDVFSPEADTELQGLLATALAVIPA
jgi:hypothetical protein